MHISPLIRLPVPYRYWSSEMSLKSNAKNMIIGRLISKSPVPHLQWQMNCVKGVIETLTFFQEHQNTNVGLYGIDIPVQADNLFIRIQEGSNNGFVLMTVLSKGNTFSSYSITCTFRKYIKPKETINNWMIDLVNFL